MKAPYSTGILVAKMARATIPFGSVAGAIAVVLQSFGYINEEQAAAIVALVAALTAAFVAHKDLEGYKKQ